MQITKHIYNKLFHTSIGKNIIANFTKVGAIFIHQILLVPLYLIYWGTDKYSDWIVLSAITYFFSMSDMGLNSVTNNQFCISYGKKKYAECSSLIVNNYIILWSIAVIALLATLSICFFFNITKLLGLLTLSRQEASYIITLLIFKIFLDMSSLIPDAIYNAKSMSAKGTYINTILKLSVSLITLFGILLKLSIAEIVTISVFPTIISIIYKHFQTKRLFIIGNIKLYNPILLKQILKPSISYMSFPVGLAFLYQGFTLVVSRFFGAETLVLFNTTRTMVNFIRNMSEIVTSGVKSEFSLAYGRNDHKRMEMIYRRSLWGTLSITCLCCMVLLIGGQWIYELWTRGKIEFSITLMLSFFVVIVFNTIWNTNGVILMATNKHTKLGVIYLFSSIIALATAFYLSKFRVIELTALCISISDLIASYYSYKFAKRIINQKEIYEKDYSSV
jgi:O-antigen/teichoic acid export membrane protein